MQSGYHGRKGLHLCSVEILEEVALALVVDARLGPFTDLVSLLLTSREIWSKLSLRNNNILYSSIFSVTFDQLPIGRRTSKDLGHADSRSCELVARFTALKRIRSQYLHFESIPPSILRNDLWKIYLMFIENEGNNLLHLIHARVGDFARNFVLGRLKGRFHGNKVGTDGWRVDNELEALAAWVFWFTDKDRAINETLEERRRIRNAFAHVFVGSFKYASSHAPITSFQIPPVTHPPQTPHTPALPLGGLPVSRRTTICSFAHQFDITPPLLSTAAMLVCIVRIELDSAKTHVYVPWYVPRTRILGATVNWLGPTVEDYEEWERPLTLFPEWDTRLGCENGNTSGWKYEHDWNRLRKCYDPWGPAPSLKADVYTPGMLDGVWAGRYFTIPKAQFDAIIFPSNVTAFRNIPPRVDPVPMQFRLREHHQHMKDKTLGFNDISTNTEDGIFRAWLPKGTTFKVQENSLLINAKTKNPLVYRTYDATAPKAHRTLNREFSCAASDGNDDLSDQNVYDILLTAETDTSFAGVWGYHSYYGRVRAWDGLIVLVRQHTWSESSWIFRGYVHGRQNLVGRWRETFTPIDLPGWEGVWSMTKVG